MNVLISGYYGYNNAGDELILESIVKGLRPKKGEAAITVLSADPRKTEAMHGVRAADRWSLLTLIREIKRCDILISGGGGLFQDDTGSFSLYYYLAVILLARWLGKKVFVYGVGINELRKPNRVLTAYVLRKADRITVREDFSRRMLAAWGCPPGKIAVTADPVLLKETQLNGQRDENPRIAFVLRPPRSGAWPVETLAALADSLNHRLHAQALFIPFQIEHDLQFMTAIAGAMRTPARILRWNDLRELHVALDDVDLVISQRLHALILGALHGVPLVGISEDPKIGRFLSELGQKNIPRVTDVSVSALLAVILDMWEWREDFRKNVVQLLPSFKARAHRTNELLLTELADL